jgi:hypothetical protein
MKIFGLNITQNKDAEPKKEGVVEYTAQPLQRLKLDIARWRSALLTAENVLNPHRVEVQRNYNEIALNAQIKACVEKRKNLTLLRDYDFKKGDTEIELENIVLVEKIINGILDAEFYGYTLLQIESIEKGKAKVCTIPRERVIPEKETISTSSLYDNVGIKIYDPLYEPWLLWFTTESESSNTSCGLGLFNVLAPYEIYVRNANTAWSEFQQIFGVPLRIGKTNIREARMRDNMSNMLRDMGRSGWATLDHDDSVEMVGATNNGSSTDTFLGMIEYCNKAISKVILGHADALDSTAGKLGADSSVEEALDVTQRKDGLKIEYILNNYVFPKLVKIGLIEFDGVNICFEDNKARLNEELQEIEIANKKLANMLIAYQMGLQPNPKDVSELLDSEVTNNEEKIKEVIQNRLNGLY